MEHISSLDEWMDESITFVIAADVVVVVAAAIAAVLATDAPDVAAAAHVAVAHVAVAHVATVSLYCLLCVYKCNFIVYLLEIW